MAPHSSTLAWKIPWTEEPGRLQSMGSLRVGYDSVTSLSRIGEGNGNPLQCSCLENPRDRGAWWAAVYGVTQSWTRLKQLSSSCNHGLRSNGDPLLSVRSMLMLPGRGWVVQSIERRAHSIILCIQHILQEYLSTGVCTRTGAHLPTLCIIFSQMSTLA